MNLSVVIPAHNEAEVVEPTLRGLIAHLGPEGIDYEIVVVDDGSPDGTGEVVARVTAEEPRVRCVRNEAPNGFGFAVRKGLEPFEGDAVVIVMADGSDDPRDVVLYYRVLEAGYDCAFGSRFMPGAVVRDYPRLKLLINRIVNAGIRALFRHGYNDTTNAFKAYRREVIENLHPLLSHHFNLTVELPLKAITRGFSYAIVPTSWTNRAAGTSKLQLNEMGSRYLFIVLYVFLEHHLSRGDYRRPPTSPPAAAPRPPRRGRRCTAQVSRAGCTAASSDADALDRPQLQQRLSLLVSVVALAAVAWWISKQDAPQFPDGLAATLAASPRSASTRSRSPLAAGAGTGSCGSPRSRTSAPTRYRLTLVGYMGNNVLPARGGEVLRIALLGARTTAKRRTILGSIIAERILDAAVLAALFAVLTWAGVAGARPASGRRRWPRSRSCSAAIALAATSRCAAAGTSSGSTRRCARSRARSRCSRTPRACCWPRCRP